MCTWVNPPLQVQTQSRSRWCQIRSNDRRVGFWSVLGPVKDPIINENDLFSLFSLCEPSQDVTQSEQLYKDTVCVCVCVGNHTPPETQLACWAKVLLGPQLRPLIQRVWWYHFLLQKGGTGSWSQSEKIVQSNQTPSSINEWTER